MDGLLAVMAMMQVLRIAADKTKTASHLLPLRLS